MNRYPALITSLLRFFPLKFFVSLILVSLCFYFYWQAVYSRKGVINYLRLSKQLKVDYNQLQNIKAEKLFLENKIDLLSQNGLDLDLIEELARQNLGIANSIETVIINPNPQ